MGKRVVIKDQISLFNKLFNKDKFIKIDINSPYPATKNKIKAKKLVSRDLSTISSNLASVEAAFNGSGFTFTPDTLYCDNTAKLNISSIDKIEANNLYCSNVLGLLKPDSGHFPDYSKRLDFSTTNTNATLADVLITFGSGYYAEGLFPNGNKFFQIYYDTTDNTNRRSLLFSTTGLTLGAGFNDGKLTGKQTEVLFNTDITLNINEALGTGEMFSGDLITALENEILKYLNVSFITPGYYTKIEKQEFIVKLQDDGYHLGIQITADWNFGSTEFQPMSFNIVWSLKDGDQPLKGYFYNGIIDKKYQL